MTWTLTYTAAAKDELATIWMDATDRQVIADAANAIERELRLEPLNVGESRDGNRRLVIKAPIAVHFFAVPDDMKVVVFHV